MKFIIWLFRSEYFTVKCPGCLFYFSSEKALNRHQENCLHSVNWNCLDWVFEETRWKFNSHLAILIYMFYLDFEFTINFIYRYLLLAYLKLYLSATCSALQSVAFLKKSLFSIWKFQKMLFDIWFKPIYLPLLRTLFIESALHYSFLSSIFLVKYQKVRWRFSV